MALCLVKHRNIGHNGPKLALLTVSNYISNLAPGDGGGGQTPKNEIEKIFE